MNIEYYIDEVGIYRTEKMIKTSKEWKQFVKDADKRDRVWNSSSFRKEQDEAENIVANVLKVERCPFTRNMAIMCCNDEWPWIPCKECV